MGLMHDRLADSKLGHWLAELDQDTDSVRKAAVRNAEETMNALDESTDQIVAELAKPATQVSAHG